MPIPPEIMEKLLRAYDTQGQGAYDKKAKETKDKRMNEAQFAGPYRMENKPLRLGPGQTLPYKPGEKPDIMQILGMFGQGSISGPAGWGNIPLGPPGQIGNGPTTIGGGVGPAGASGGTYIGGPSRVPVTPIPRGPSGPVGQDQPGRPVASPNPPVQVPGPVRRPVTPPPPRPTTQGPSWGPTQGPDRTPVPTTQGPSWGPTQDPDRGPVPSAAPPRGPVAAPQKPPMTGTSYHGGPDSIYNRAITSQRPTAAGRKW